MLELNQTVGGLVGDHPECAPVFRSFGIDYCCKGTVTLAGAAATAGIPPEQLVARLAAAIAIPPAGSERVWREAGTSELIAHICNTHHHFLREQLPFLLELAQRVQAVHGAREPRLANLAELLHQLAHALLPHLESEERDVFPALLAPSAPPVQVQSLLIGMIDEHRDIGELLLRLRRVAEDYRVPPEACNSYRALFAGLERLEADTHRHVHLENYVLAERFEAGAAATRHEEIA